MNAQKAIEAIAREQEQLERELYYKQKALDYILREVDDDEEVDINEIYRSIAEEAEYNYQIAEENSLRSAWQQDLIDLYRFER